MAHTISQLLASQLPDPNDTQDYGSDLDDEELEELNREVDRIYGLQKTTKADIEDNPITNDVEFIPTDVSVARVPNSSQPRLSQSQRINIELEDDRSTERIGDGRNTTVTYPDRKFSHLFTFSIPSRLVSAPLSTISPSQLDAEGPEPPETEVDPASPSASPFPDTRPPILRYRAPPRKALSVTDLVSPAWCELQYSFDLSKHGRKRATPAMKKGTVVHEKLEAEVYTSVPVNVTTKEEKWGLKLWNVISGLGILAETGMTRELEVWGLVSGEVVGGVVDEVSLECPNPAVEAALERSGARKEEEKNGEDKKEVVKEGQSTLDSFMLGCGSTTLAEAMHAQPLFQPLSQSTFQPPPSQPISATPTLYITDVKTRRARSIPNDVSARPTKYQLMLYNRMLSNMIANTFAFQLVADHYNLDMHAPFSDSFIAQIASLDADGLDVILSHNSLAGLWSLVPGAFGKVAQAHGPTLAEHAQLKVSPILTAEYRDSSTGDVRGTKTFLYDDEVLDDYISNGMEWWRGERPARGVEIDEAFKCQICQFAPECEWRKSKVEEAIMRNRSNGAMRKDSGSEGVPVAEDGEKGRRGGSGIRKTKSKQSGFAPMEVVDEMEHPSEKPLGVA